MADDDIDPELLAKREKKVLRRKKIRDKIEGDMGVSHLPSEGRMNELIHIWNMKEEVIAMRMLLDLLFFGVSLVLNLPYQEQKRYFNEGLIQEIEALKGGEKVRLVYQPDVDGKWPTLYYVDPEGKIDYTRKIPQGEETRFDIRQNGLIPVPSYTEGWQAACDKHVHAMMGGRWMSPQQLSRIGKFLKEVGEGHNMKDPLAERRLYDIVNQPNRPRNN